MILINNLIDALELAKQELLNLGYNGLVIDKLDKQLNDAHRFFSCLKFSRDDLIASLELRRKEVTEDDKAKLMAISDDKAEWVSNMIANNLLDGGDYWEGCYYHAQEILSDELAD